MRAADPDEYLDMDDTDVDDFEAVPGRNAAVLPGPRVHLEDNPISSSAKRACAIPLPVSLLARPRCRRCSPASQCRFPSSALGLRPCVNGGTTTFTFSTFSPWLPQSIRSSKRIPGGHTSLGILAHFPICLRQTQDSSPGASPATHQRCSVDNSANYTCRDSHLGSPQLRACNSHASSLDRDLQNGAILSGKNNKSNSSILRTFRLRHQSCSLTVRVSLQMSAFETIPSARIPVPVKSEPPRGSYLSPSGYVWNWLGHVGGVTGAHHSFCGCAQLNIPPQFCACCFLFTLEVCLTLSLQESSIRSHAHDPSQEHLVPSLSKQKKDALKVQRHHCRAGGLEALVVHSQ